MTKSPYRVLVVEDDPHVATYVRDVLEQRLGALVIVVSDAFGFEETIRSFAPDVLLTDIELPGATGLELAAAARALEPAISVIVMTGHSSVDYAVQALRGGAHEFLQKPLKPKDLIDAVSRFAETARAAHSRRRRRTVLAIGAHPDDVEIGVGGTLAAHAAAGDPVTILTLSRGARGGMPGDRQNESLAAAELIGARLFLEDLPDTMISGGDPTMSIIERVVTSVAPTTVYVHSRHDRHQDHRAVHEATLIATRRVENVACYQSPSTSVDFRPSRFVAIDGFTQTKLDLLACFASQAGIREYLEPDLVLATARYWSRFGTTRHVEPLEVIRDSSGIGVDSDHTTADAPRRAEQVMHLTEEAK